MKAYDYTEKGQHGLAKQQSLKAIDARIKRHEKVTWIILVLVVILAGLSLALLATHLINYSN